MDKKLLSLWGPPLVWCLLIFSLSSVPQLQVTSEPLWNFLTRKFSHLLEYGVLAILLYRATGYKKAYLAFMLTVIYAITDETHQNFVPSREGKLTDIIIDSIGALLGLYLWIKQPLPHKKLRRWLRSS